MLNRNSISGNFIRAVSLAIAITGAVTPLQAQLRANATVTATQVNPNLYHYDLVLRSLGTTTVGTFWFAWVPGYDFLPNASNIRFPAGWGANLTHASASDGYGIEWFASGAASYLAAGQALPGFSFESSITPDQIAGASAFFPFNPVETSYVYSGAPFSDAGFTFLATNTQSSNPTAPTVTTLTPGGGSGSTATFTFKFADTGGFQSLTVVDALINNVLDGRNACYIAFVPSGANSGSVYLVDDLGDAGGPYAGMMLPGAGTVSNSQCSIAGTGSSVSGAGNTLTLSLAVTFMPAFAGNKVLYLSAQNADVNSGWQALGTWNAPGAALTGPAVSGVTPTPANGATQMYTFTFTDTNGAQDISVANILVNSAINGIGACYLAFVPSGANAGSVYLVDDAGDAGGPYVGLTLPGANTISNSQCTVGGAGAQVTANGNTLTLMLPITYSHSFAGNQIMYLAARNNANQNSGWQSVGSISVP